MEVDSIVPSPYCQAFQLKSLPLSPDSLSPPMSLVHSGGYSQPPTSWGCLFSILSASPQGFSPFPSPNKRSGSSLPSNPIHFPSWVPPIPTCDCFLPSPKWECGTLLICLRCIFASISHSSVSMYYFIDYYTKKLWVCVSVSHSY
jgi:hypothetical protein